MNTNHVFQRVMIVCALLLGISSIALAMQEVKILPDDPENGDQFGRAVDISGNYMILGAHEDDDLGNRSGSAYIFKWVTDAWVQDSKLTAPDGAAGAQFGYSVSISGDYALVGAFRDDGNATQAGAAYVFKNNGGTWQFAQKLTPTIPENHSEFGVCVVTDGNFAVVGAHHAEHLGQNTGAVYVFERNGATWIQQAKLVEDDLSVSGSFGCAVDLYGNQIAVGASRDGTSGVTGGAVYLYEYSGASWELEQRIYSSDSSHNDQFGKDVSMWHDWLLVGAPGATGLAPDTGAAYMFRKSGESWVQADKLSPDPPEPDQSFGWSVAVKDGDAIVSAPWYTPEGYPQAGKVYIYRETSTDWSFSYGVVASDPVTNASFGFEVAVQNNEAIIGAFGALHEGDYSGAGYWLQDFTPVDPTPTPVPTEIVYELSLYDTSLQIDDLFKLSRTFFNPDGATPVDEYILLDLFDNYWFWPSWSESLDFITWNLPVSDGRTDTILEFIWPMVDGTADELRFWGAFLQAGTADLMIYDMIEWGYSNK